MGGKKQVGTKLNRIERSITGWEDKRKINEEINRKKLVRYEATKVTR